MIFSFFRKDLRDNLLTWIVCLLVSVVLYVSMYSVSAMMPKNGNMIISQEFTMFVNLIPLIYLILCGKNLIVKKVDDGSFYLDMVSGYRRRDILLTKMVYYISSLFVMYLILTITGLICAAAKPWDLTYGNVIYLFFMSFLLNLSLSSIIFCSSSYFNSAKNATLIGAGIPILSYVFVTISGMFVNIPGLEDNALANLLIKLKYLSFHSLYSYDEIIAASNFNYIGIGVFLGVSVLFYALSFPVFTKKDLPL